MAAFHRGRFRKKLVLLLGPFGLVGCRTTESYVAGVPDKAWPAHAFLADRAAVQDPLLRQAVNGAGVHATVFNYYFEPDATVPVLDRNGVWTGQNRTLAVPLPTARLSPWGKELLNRLARQAIDQQVCVYVQTGADVAAGAGAPAAVAKARAELDAKRVQAVQEYLAAMRPDLVAVVNVSDPNPVGMSGRESRVGFDKMLLAPTGNLTQSAILGADIGAGLSTLQGGSSQGSGPGQAPPLTPQEPPPPPNAPMGGLAPGAPVAAPAAAAPTGPTPTPDPPPVTTPDSPPM